MITTACLASAYTPAAFDVAPDRAGIRERLALLLYDTKAGHAGGRPVATLVEDLSIQMTFHAKELGMAVGTRRADR